MGGRAKNVQLTADVSAGEIYTAISRLSQTEASSHTAALQLPPLRHLEGEMPREVRGGHNCPTRPWSDPSGREAVTATVLRI